MISGGAPSSLVVPSPQPQRSEDTPDPDFMTKFRAFLMEEFSVELDLTLGWKTPTVGGQKLDLAKLYHEVIKRNGHKEVTSTKQWKRVADAFQLPKSLTSASFLMRSHYERYLYEFEARNFGRQRGQAPAALANSGHATGMANPAGWPLPSGSHGLPAHHVYPAAAHHMPHAHQYQHPHPHPHPGVYIATTQAQPAAYQQPSIPTMPFVAAHHVPPTATASQTVYNQMVPNMTDVSRPTGFPNVYTDASPSNQYTQLPHPINMEGFQAANRGGPMPMPPVGVGVLALNQLQWILQNAHEEALRVVEPIQRKLENRIAFLEEKTAQLEALGKRMNAMLSDHEQRHDERQRAEGNRQASEEESENVHDSEGAGIQDNEDAQPSSKRVTLVDRKGRGGGGFAPYDKAGHNGSKWCEAPRTQSGEVCTSASHGLTCPPVNGEVNTATTKTALGGVEASQDKKRSWHEAIGAMAVGGANVAQLPPADTPATE